MENKGKVLLVAPAKIGGKRYPAGATPEVTPEIALQLAEMGAIDANPTEIEKVRTALGIAREHTVEGVSQIVDLMQGEKAEALKTDAGNWSAAKIGAALGRKVAPAEIEAAETVIRLQQE